jgi:hypothetical protein
MLYFLTRSLWLFRNSQRLPQQSFVEAICLFVLFIIGLNAFRDRFGLYLNFENNAPPISGWKNWILSMALMAWLSIPLLILTFGIFKLVSTFLKWDNMKPHLTLVGVKQILLGSIIWLVVYCSVAYFNGGVSKSTQQCINLIRSVVPGENEGRPNNE